MIPLLFFNTFVVLFRLRNLAEACLWLEVDSMMTVVCCSKPIYIYIYIYICFFWLLLVYNFLFFFRLILDSSFGFHFSFFILFLAALGL